MNQTPVQSTEIWRAHPDYPCYDVSTHGRIRSWHNGKHGWRDEPRLLKLLPGNSGYESTRLSYKGKGRTVAAHTLVLEVFVGNRPGPDYEARHLNGDQRDNRLENLAWGTRAENAADKEVHGTKNYGERNGMARLTAAQVSDARLLRSLGVKVSILATHYRVSQSTMSTALNGKTWGHLEVVR